MGWHRIDPETGMPLKEGRSKLSSPEVKLLNAVPGVDHDDAACYLGDGPWDMSSSMPAEIGAVTGDALRLSDEQIRDLLLRRVLPPGVAPETGTELLRVTDAFWKDINSC